MRLATYNVEWFSSLFNANSQLELNSKWSARRDITRIQQLDAVAHVLQTIDADCVLIVEAPDTHRKATTTASLTNFSKHYGLRLTSVLTGFTNDTRQEIALFYDDQIINAVHDPQGGTEANDPNPRFDGVFHKDVDVDDKPEAHRFSKPPLEALVSHVNGRYFRLIGVHVKSKAPHGAQNKNDEIRISIQNRRKQLAQSLWIRRKVEALLQNGEDVIVLGDFNDGPGLDHYEQLFGQSSVEIVLGKKSNPDLQLFDPHAMARLDPRQSWSPSTARFYIHHRKNYLNALLDFIMIPASMNDAGNPEWKIWHPFDDKSCFSDKALSDALLTASDHFPVTLDLTL